MRRSKTIKAIQDDLFDSYYNRHTSYKKVIDVNEFRLGQKDMQFTGLMDQIHLE